LPLIKDLKKLVVKFKRFFELNLLVTFDYSKRMTFLLSLIKALKKIGGKVQKIF